MNIKIKKKFPLVPKQTEKRHLIFVVEDNQLYSFMLDYKLHLNKKYLIMSFLTGEECLKNIGGKPDVVILDSQLPGINGIEILKKIKAFDPNIQVIFISKYDEPEIKIKAFKEGVYDYLVKGRDTIKDLDKLITKVIGSIEFKNTQERNFTFKKIWKMFFILTFAIIIFQIIK